jgi:cellulose synthase/poly-beta-1,6-N-acetylglucosamine synthase-like glycosyltransferase
VNGLLIALGLWGYAYIGYPAILVVLAQRRRRGLPRVASGPLPRVASGPLPGVASGPLPRVASGPLPRVSIVLPVYNEAAVIADTLEAVLALDYPRDRLQILVISDASTDATDGIVAGFASQGVELARQHARRGKTAAENAAWPRLDGDIVLCTDASVRVHPAAVRALVAEFDDPSVGVASGRDVSVSRLSAGANPGESAYVGYEMLVRDRETLVGGIVGASGCLYAIRARLHRHILPNALSRDFAAVLHAHLHGFRAVSVRDAICYVPRGASLRQEYRRKVRTMTRGLGTLFHYRRLLDPRRHGVFAWMLASHKLCRWLLPWASLAIVAELAALAPEHPLAVFALAAVGAACAAAAVTWVWPDTRPVPRLLAAPAFAVCGLLAGLHAWLRLFSRRPAPVWEPTRRDSWRTAP